MAGEKDASIDVLTVKLEGVASTLEEVKTSLQQLLAHDRQLTTISATMDQHTKELTTMWQRVDGLTHAIRSVDETGAEGLREHEVRCAERLAVAIERINAGMTSQAREITDHFEGRNRVLTAQVETTKSALDEWVNKGKGAMFILGPVLALLQVLVLTFVGWNYVHLTDVEKDVAFFKKYVEVIRVPGRN